MTSNKEHSSYTKLQRLPRRYLTLPDTGDETAIALAHEGHQGLVKTKKLLREKVWFPGIDKQIINRCVACQANGPENRPDPLQMSPLPPEPWHTVHVDFCGPFPSGEYLFVVIDAYSRSPRLKFFSKSNNSQA